MLLILYHRIIYHIYRTYYIYIIILQHIQSSFTFKDKSLPSEMVYLVNLAPGSSAEKPRHIKITTSRFSSTMKYIVLFGHFVAKTVISRETTTTKKNGLPEKISAKAEGSQGNCVGEGCFCLGETEVPGTKSLMND